MGLHEGSFKQRCKELGIDYWRALKRREAGMPEEKIFAEGFVRSQKVTSTAVSVNGVFYPSIKAACDVLKPPASGTTIERWIKGGTSPEDAFARVPNPGYRNGIIYCITHTATGKRYIGLTVQSLERRWKYHLEQAAAGFIKGHASLHAAIREFGADAFTIAKIDSGTTKLGLELKEREWIAALDTLAPAGFNLDPGGVSGGSSAKPQTVDGVRFASTGLAVAYIADKYGISEHAAKKRLLVGRIDVRKPAKPGASLVKSKAYKAWSAIIHGAMNPASKDYQPNVDLHHAWRLFDVFLADVGHPADPESCFARVDKSKGFEPSNCRWMSKSEASQINAAYMKATGRLTGRPARVRSMVQSGR